MVQTRSMALAKRKQNLMLRRGGSTAVLAAGTALANSAIKALGKNLSTRLGYRPSVSSVPTSRNRVSRVRRVSNRKSKKRMVQAIKNEIQKTKNVGIFKYENLADIDIVNGTNGRDTFSFSSTFQGVNSAPAHTVYAHRYIPFSTVKVMYAASVLYNNRTANGDFGSDVGNFPPEGFKCKVQYASYKGVLTNMTTQDYRVTLYVFKNKEDSNQPVEQIISDLRSREDYRGGSIPTWNIGSNTVDSSSVFEPGELKGLARHYTMTKRTQLVRRGETMTYFTKMVDKVFDYTKNQDEDGLTASYAKGDIQIMFRFTPVTYLGHTATQIMGLETTGGTNPSWGWIYKVQETYKILEPEDTNDTYEGNCRVIETHYPNAGASTGNRFARTAPVTTYEFTNNLA